MNIEVQFTDFIMPICLGEADFIRRTFFSYKDLRYGSVAGWGKLSEGGGQPRFLQEIKLPLVVPEKCRASTTHPVSELHHHPRSGKQKLLPVPALPRLINTEQPPDLAGSEVRTALPGLRAQSGANGRVY